MRTRAAALAFAALVGLIGCTPVEQPPECMDNVEGDWREYYQENCANEVQP